ncbi:3-hydroxyisobutyryl-CoA hydrolase, mitochondrial-like isoform X2 [Argopecten irradians]
MFIRRTLQRVGIVLQHVKMAAPKSSFSSVAEDEVLLQTINSTGVITLNRPKALNALNLNMIRRIYPQMTSWEEDPKMRMVIIKGAGEKAFCAGGDIRAVTEAGKVGDPLSQNFFKEEYILNFKIGTYDIPYVAFIDGITMGGGVGLSVHGDFRVATEKTLFAMPETAIGLFPDVGGGYFLPRLGGSLGVFMALTGFRLKGRHVQKAGVATHFVQSNKISELEAALIGLDNPSHHDITTVIEDFQSKSTDVPDEDFILKPDMDKINRLFSAKTLEGIFQDLKNDGSDWATKQLQTLQKMSPTSMKITLRQILEGRNLSLGDCLQMEYRLSQRCIDDKDFYEGVRAVLVDKDQSPKWDPATIEGVTSDKVDWYFSVLPAERELQL